MDDNDTMLFCLTAAVAPRRAAKAARPALSGARLIE